MLPALLEMIRRNAGPSGFGNFGGFTSGPSAPAAPSANAGFPNWNQLTGGFRAGDGWWNWQDNATRGGVVANLIEKLFAPRPGGVPSSAPSVSSTTPAASAVSAPPSVQQLYATGRFAGAPAFAPTLAQVMFPGSRIGPGGSSVANPYVNTGHGTPNSVFTGLSGPATDAFVINRQRNAQ